MAAGDPQGPDLASMTRNTDGLTNQNAWTVFTFDSPTTLIGGEQYAVVVGSFDGLITDSLFWRQDTAAGYAGGHKCVSGDSGASWTQSPTRDCTFRLNSAGGQVQSFETYDAFQAIYVPFYAAQVFTASSTFDIVSVGLQISIVALVTRIITISIRDVETAFDPPVATGLNNMKTIRRLVAAANNKFWYEDI